MLVFVEGGKPENPEKTPRSKDENQQQTQPTHDVESGNRTRATMCIAKTLNVKKLKLVCFTLAEELTHFRAICFLNYCARLEGTGGGGGGVLIQ